MDTRGIVSIIGVLTTLGVITNSTVAIVLLAFAVSLSTFVAGMYLSYSHKPHRGIDNYREE